VWKFITDLSIARTRRKKKEAEIKVTTILGEKGADKELRCQADSWEMTYIRHFAHPTLVMILLAVEILIFCILVAYTNEIQEQHANQPEMKVLEANICYNLVLISAFEVFSST
jgi:hypothetical protein